MRHKIHSPLTHILLLFCAQLLWGCTGESTLSVQIKVFHQLLDLPKLDIMIDGVIEADVDPNELSRGVFVSEGAHEITLKVGGETDPLVNVQLNELSERTHLIIVRGDERTPEVITATRPLPPVSVGHHHLEVINLADPALSFKLYVSSDPERPFLSTPFEGPAGSTTLSPFIQLSAGDNLTITTENNDLIEADLQSESASILLVTSTPPSPDEVSLKFKLMRTSL
jgi:hypothetical protein